MVEFKEEPRGTVVSMGADEFAGIIYHIWFPYTREYVNKIREGDFVAVRNFASIGGSKTFSVLEIVSALPVHYALGSSPSETERAFPGFVVEAARSARVDWEQEEPVEQTTKIKTEAIPTGLQLDFGGEEGSSPDLIDDKSLPMIGEEALLLTDELMNSVVNRGLIGSEILTVAPCSLVLNRNVRVYLSVDDLLRTHFGVIGFTGAGKSNLMSTVIAALLGADEKPLKVVLFDLMSEYTGLLLDIIDQLEQAYIVALGKDSLPGGEPTRDYLYGGVEKEDEAVDSIVRTMLLPKELATARGLFSDCVRRVLRARKIRIYHEEPSGLRVSDVRSALEERVKGNLGVAAGPLDMWLEQQLGGEGFEPVPIQQIEGMIENIEDFLQNGIPESFARMPAQAGQPPVQSTLSGTSHASSQRGVTRRLQLNPTARGVMLMMKEVLNRYISAPSERPPDASVLSRSEIRRILDSGDQSSLIVVQSNRDDELRSQSAHIVNTLFSARRRIGRIDPTVLFAYDEADEFMPGTAREGSSYSISRDAVETLARRGRKFGMGLAIATQRAAYLATSVLAQPHTYLISKLPRKYDREAMANAFGITEDIMQKTLKFSKGQWLLMSFDATGLANVPLPVQFLNANERILNYLRMIDKGSQSTKSPQKN